MNLTIPFLEIFTAFFVPSTPQAVYQEWLTRYKFYPFAAGAYSDQPQLCLNNSSPSSRFVKRYEVVCDAANSTCSGYLAISPAEQAIILAFRGTNSDGQLAYETQEIPKMHWANWTAGGRVAQYFYDAFSSVWNSGMSKDFANLTATYPTYQLWISGHSLGGAMAALGASFIAHNNLFPRNKIFLTTFGEPRVGDCDFAASVNREIMYSYRVVHANDIFVLQGTNSTIFCHHKAEIWYPNNMTSSSPYTICDTECNPNPVNLSITDHMVYFEKQVMAYGRGGCVN